MKINTQFAETFISKKEELEFLEKAVEQLKTLKNRKGKGNEFLGWFDLPSQVSEIELEKINKSAKHLQNYETVVVVGIGGSYLGSKAVIDLFKPYFAKQKTEILFAGQNLDEEYIDELLAYLHDKNFGIIVISKSGTTLEPALSFRLLLNKIIEKFGVQEVKERVVAITDKDKGALKELANFHQLETFVVPDDVGGRYSVLTPVGLLPIAVAGIDINEILAAAKSVVPILQEETIQNPAIIYAAYRNLLYQKGFSNEIMVYSKPKWSAFADWWKQLFGESEGKENKGIFPVSMNITTELHSLGQYVQEGERKLFETFIRFNEQKTELEVSHSDSNYDKLNYLTEKSIHNINNNAEEGTVEAHSYGGVPVLQIELEKLDVRTIGQLVYFFEISCAISAYMLGVNPFNQPGVEAYKQNMFRLLGK